MDSEPINPLEEPEENIEKFFDEAQYNTIIVNSAGFSTKMKEVGDLLVSLLAKNTSREQKEEALELLKKQDGRVLLIQAIQQTDQPEYKARLIAACWEAGMDFSNSFDFFVELACDDHYMVALEAYTVLESTEGLVKPEVLEAALERVKEKLKEEPMNEALLNDTLRLIEDRLKQLSEK